MLRKCTASRAAWPKTPQEASQVKRGRFQTVMQKQKEGAPERASEQLHVKAGQTQAAFPAQLTKRNKAV